jgi:hypothetical protein
MLLIRRAGPVLFLGSALALGGCGSLATAPGPTSGPQRLEAEARATLTAMQARFVDGRAEEFLGYFNGRVFPDFDDFQQRVRQFLLHDHQITMDIVVDSVLRESGEVSVQAHWNRSFVTSAGSPQMQEGRCEILFQARPSGGLETVLIHGQSPF